MQIGSILKQDDHWLHGVRCSNRISYATFIAEQFENIFRSAFQYVLFLLSLSMRPHRKGVQDRDKFPWTMCGVWWSRSCIDVTFAFPDVHASYVFCHNESSDFICHFFGVTVDEPRRQNRKRRWFPGRIQHRQVRVVRSFCVKPRWVRSHVADWPQLIYWRTPPVVEPYDPHRLSWCLFVEELN